MKRKSIFFLIVFSLFWLGIVVKTPAQTKPSSGGLAGAATRIGFGARGIGMGNALTTVRGGELVGYYNPALAPFQTLPTATATLGVMSLDRRLNFLSYTQAIQPAGGISVGIINAGVSKIEGRDRDGRTTETYSTSENAFLFSFGLKPVEAFAFGVTAKGLYYSLFEGVSSTTVGFDLGILYLISDEWTLGAVVQDINSKYRWDSSPVYGRDGNTTTDRFPLRKRIGISYSPSFYPTVISAEVETISDDVLTRIGAEVSPFNGIRFRGGIDQISFAGNLNAKPSLGLAVQTPFNKWMPTIHYTYVIEPYSAGAIHFLSISLAFE